VTGVGSSNDANHKSPQNTPCIQPRIPPIPNNNQHASSAPGTLVPPEDQLPRRTPTPALVSRVDDLTRVHDSGDDTEGMEIGRVTARGWPQIPLQFVMQQPQGMVHWPSGLGPPIVAGTMIGLVMVPEAPLP
jgi:hypothetical protein